MNKYSIGVIKGPKSWWLWIDLPQVESFDTHLGPLIHIPVWYINNFTIIYFTKIYDGKFINVPGMSVL